MFERFTERARRVVILAQEESRRMNHDYIGTEHILLGLIGEGQSIAARALESLGIGLEPARQQVEEIIGRGQRPPSGHVPFTPRTKKVLELSLREALQLGHSYIGPEHILLGLLREGQGVAVQVLARLGADSSRIRQQVASLIGAEREEAGAEGAQAPAQGKPAGPAEAGSRPARQAPETPRLRQARVASRDIWQLEALQLLSRIADRLDAIERHVGMKGSPAEPGSAEAQGGQPPEDLPGAQAGQPPEDLPGAQAGEPGVPQRKPDGPPEEKPGPQPAGE